MKNYFYLFCSLLLMACEKDEIKPRTNPQFSIAFIQDIDESGVEFAANIYDYGSVEILEYGFVYDRNTNPRVERSELVKAEGIPDKFFSLKAIHSMVKGQTYNVAAYIKTTESTVYSALISFKSEGSTGFIYEKIEMPEPLYFGDTVTVWGKNMSRDPSLYQFFIQGAKADILEVNNDNFKVRLPSLFDFFQNEDLPLSVQIHVVDKIFKINQKVEFKSPTFVIEPTDFNYTDTLIIRGSLLDSKVVSIKYKEGNTLHDILPVSVSGEKVAFIPKVPFETLEPEFILTIRGNSYSFKNFKINATDIIEGKAISQPLGAVFKVEVINLNPFFPQSHQLFVPSIENTQINLVKTENNFLYYQIPSYSQIIFPRTFNIGMVTNNYTSKSKIEMNLTDASIKFFNVPLSFSDYTNGRGISHRGKGYLFLGSNISVVDPVNKNIEKVASVPNNYGSLIYLFLEKHSTGKMYMGGYDNEGDAIMRSFDPETNTINFLGKIPSQNLSPRAVYITDQYLYYEGTIIYENEIVYERYRYDLMKKEWIQLEKTNTLQNDLSHWYTFTYEGNLLSFHRKPKTGDLQLQQFDKTTERWHALATYPYTGIIQEVLYSREYIFYYDGSGKYRINMRNLNREKVSNISPFFNYHMSFQSDKKFYLYSAPFFYEYDPEYFTY